MRLTLVDEGYEVVEAATAHQALSALKDTDVVLLDLTLPDGDGVQLCRRIRATSNVPVIMVTGRAESQQVVAGLEAGADDYVTKPVVGSELAARVRAVLRRINPTLANRLVVGDLELLVHKGVARRTGRELHLTRTEFRLLVDLAAHAGDVVTREELVERVWGCTYFGDTRLLDVHVRRLRMKVEDDPEHPRLITTVRGLGYRLSPQLPDDQACRAGARADLGSPDRPAAGAPALRTPAGGADLASRREPG